MKWKYILLSQKTFLEIQVHVKCFYALKSITQLHEQVRWKTYTGFIIIIFYISMMITSKVILKEPVISLMEDLSHLFLL